MVNLMSPHAKRGGVRLKNPNSSLLPKSSKVVVLIDKPAGITSRAAAESVRTTLGARKAGDTGTLDPSATGVLIVCLDESTKAMPLLMGLDKEYISTIGFHREINKQQLIDGLKAFTGNVKQLPPVKSAVARKERVRKVYSIELLKFSGNKAEVKICCEAGFYVRKFAHDLGQFLGCGAQSLSIRRTAIGKISLAECVKPSEVSPENSISLEELLEKIWIKKVSVKKEALTDIKNGRKIKKEHIIESDIGEANLIGIYMGKEIVALGKVFREKGEVYIKPDRVFN